MAATLTIGIPTRNRAGLLRQALRYATQQTLPCHVIVHDNAGEDDTEAVVAKVAGCKRERQFRMFVIGPIIEEGGWETAYRECLRIIGQQLRQRWLAELHVVRDVHPAVAKVAAEIQACA